MNPDLLQRQKRNSSDEKVKNLKRYKIFDKHEIKKKIPKLGPVPVNTMEAGERTDLLVELWQTATSQTVHVPVIVARGAKPGPVLGVSAAIHGNELNGVRIIHSLLSGLDLNKLSGALLCSPVVNVPGFNAGVRRFIDGVDLNHAFPGKKDGRPCEQYARAFLNMFLPACDYLIDIHTASQGNINSMYVRADLTKDTVRRIAELMNPDIILHAKGGDGTLRNAARTRKIPAITVEAGNPGMFQGRMVFDGESGIRNILAHFEMYPGEIRCNREPVICRDSKWLRTNIGGILDTRFGLRDRVIKGQLLARTTDLFGYSRMDYTAPHDGIVIGMATNPVAVPGARFCHLGFIGDPAREPEVTTPSG